MSRPKPAPARPARSNGRAVAPVPDPAELLDALLTALERGDSERASRLWLRALGPSTRAAL